MMFSVPLRPKSPILCVTGVALAATALSGLGGVAASATSSPASSPIRRAASLSFTNIDHTTPPLGDPMFNQALGINDKHVVVGYAGDPGTDNKPNKGWVAVAPYAQSNFRNENVPGSQQTQVVGINNARQTVGFWVDRKGDNFGFLKRGSLFTTLPGITQLLGLNNKGVAVGFATAKNGNARPMKCTYSGSSLPKCSLIALPGNPPNATATGVNDKGDIAGFIVRRNGRSMGFVLAANGTFWQPTRLGDNKGTMIFGINNADVVVGSYTAGAATHGFSASAFTGRHRTIDDPNGIGNTVLNGLNNRGQFVGFYTDANGVTHGFLAG